MSFILKNYQQRVLDGLESFLTECRFSGPAAAYKKIAHRKDENGAPENPYAAREYREIEGLEGRPHVCLRVPTGGGKTYLAALSLQHAARFMETETPTVLWFTPSEAIRRQTVEMLNNPQHPCRKALNKAFGMMTRVCDIEDFAHLRPQDFTEAACIIVSTAQMFRVSETATTEQGRMSKATRRIYATHEDLEPHFARFLPPNPPPQLERDERGEIKLSFANLLFLLRPAVVLDEAHNFVSGLSRTVLQRINPACVIEWTATPREKPGGKPLHKKPGGKPLHEKPGEKPLLHNVLLSVGAEVLRAEEMIKLPVRVTEHTGWEQAVNGAVNERRTLAKLARESHDRVRPIVLYKAQNKNAEVPVARLKQHLIETEKVAEETIAIATGEIRELGGIDLLAPDCRIEHIITVEALREGWDCPFAYVLCPVDTMHSATGVEQLLGRVLRMPFARRRQHAALNRAYAHVPTESFAEAVRELREKMATGLGFEEEEVNWAVQGEIMYQSGGQNELFEVREEDAVISVIRMPDFSVLPQLEREAVAKAIVVIPPEKGSGENAGGVKIALVKSVSPAAQAVIIDAVAADSREEEKIKIARINQELMRRRSPAERGVAFAPLTQLTFILPDGEEHVVVDAGTLYEAAEWNNLGDDFLLRDFSITETAETFEISLEAGKVLLEKMDQYQIPLLLDEEVEMRPEFFVGWLEREIREPDGCYFSETLKEFAAKNTQALLEKGMTMKQLVRGKYVLAAALKQWLQGHAVRVAEKTVQQVLFDNEDLRCEIEFTFTPHAYDPGESPYAGNYQFKKHYYDVIGKFDGIPGGEEESCAIVLDGIPEVRHWVRNVSRKPNSFALPRSTNNSFYPDFVAELTNGKILVVEYKGADRWQDSKLDRGIGELWEDHSNGRNFFVMVSKREGQPDIREQLQDKVKKIFTSGNRNQPNP